MKPISIDEALAKTEMAKRSFTQMPADPAAQGAPPAGAPPAGAPPPAQGGGIIQMLQQAGIDPNQVLQDPNMEAQLAQQAGMQPGQLAQAIQAEMGGGGAPPPPPAGAPPPEGQQQPPAGAMQDPELQGVLSQLMQGLEDTANVISQIQQEHAAVQEEFRRVSDEVIRLSENLRNMEQAVMQPSPMEGMAPGGGAGPMM
jgi:transposase-like protein